jgi:sorbitol-specific phosphotransferase system component IIBC
MWQIILNYLGTKAAAKLAPLVLVVVGLFVTYIGHKFPALAPYVTTEFVLAVVGLLLGLGMTIVNYITTARAFKYAEPVQRFLNVLAGKLGLQFINEDGVIAGVTKAKADEIEKTMSRPKGPFNPDARVLPPQP